jgi:acyl carrier protein
MTIEPELIEFIERDVSLDPSEPVIGETDLLLTGLVDSLGVIRIVQWLEERLGVLIDPADVILDNFQTVDQMLEFVSRLGVEVG